VTDERLRQLERRAKQGDPDAAAELARARERTMRDPRMHPRAGDVLERLTPTSLVSRRRVLEVHGGGTSLYAQWEAVGGEPGVDVAVTLRAWRRWARGARVLERGPDELTVSRQDGYVIGRGRLVLEDLAGNPVDWVGDSVTIPQTRGVSAVHAVMADLHALDDAQAAIARSFELTFRTDHPGDSP
jgi:hypothetical protein